MGRPHQDHPFDLAPPPGKQGVGLPGDIPRIDVAGVRGDDRLGGDRGRTGLGEAGVDLGRQLARLGRIEESGDAGRLQF